jgi:flagellar basal-body rod protein FlgG
MLRSMYSAGTAMISQMRRMDVLTNNLVNVETRGYKSETLVTRSFRDLMISRLNDPSIYKFDRVGPHSTGIHVDQKFVSFVQGGLEPTDSPMDFALVGDGFFCIDYTTEDDFDEVIRYTRNGAFNIDAEGFLVTGDGHRVLGEGGHIEVGNSEFRVDIDGVIYDANEEVIDRLYIVRFEDNSILRKEGSNMFSVFNANPEEPYEPEQVIIGVRQFCLEMSNVDTAREVVMMMQVYRSYEINQRVVRMIDESLGRAVNDIARL